MSTRAKPKKVAAGIFKSKCLKLMDDVKRNRVPLTITKRGKPIVKVVPVEGEETSLFGCMADSVVILGDIVGPSGEKWEANDE